MNISLSTGFLKPVTNFFRKYTALLPSIIITVVALLLLPLIMVKGGGVKKEMETSVRDAGAVAGLRNNVPSRNQPDVVKREMDRLQETVDRIETLAAETSMRELISYDIFPTPRGTSSQLFVTFGRRYRTAVEEMIDSIHALDAPTQTEIRNQTGADVRGAARGYQAQNRVDTTNPMVEALCRKRAQEISVYAHPTAFQWYEFWDGYEFGGQKQALIDCWDAQVAFWIYRDVVDTIAVMNNGSETVSASPVKRLLGVSFTAPVDISSGSDRSAYGGFGRNMDGMGMIGNRDKPNYILAPDTSGTDMGMVMPTTGAPGAQSNFVDAALTKRTSDEDVDVIHFTFSVLVDNRYVMAFMKELCSEKSHTYRVGFEENGPVREAVHNQITILDTDIAAVDKTAPEHELYRYGDGAVMRLDVVGEYQFYRDGYDTIKPDPVKELLGQETEQPQQDTQPGTGPGMQGMPTRRPGVF